MTIVLLKNGTPEKTWNNGHPNNAIGALSVILEQVYDYRTSKSTAEARDEIQRGVSSRKRAPAFKGSGWYSGSRLVKSGYIEVGQDYALPGGEVYRIEVRE